MSKKQRIEGQVSRTFTLQVQQKSIAQRMEDENVSDAAELSPNLVLTFPFSSEEPYTRSSWFDEPWNEVLGHADGECDLTRLNSGAPVLSNHGRYGTGDSPLALIGTTEKAWIEGGRGYVEIKLSRREGMEGLLQDIADGIVRNVSVGYQILERTLIKQNQDAPDDYRVTKWLPLEVSIVDIPADATVGIGRSFEQPAEGTRLRVIDLPDQGFLERGNNMSQAQTPASGSENQPDHQAVQRAAAEAERARGLEIRTAVRAASLEDAYADELIASGVPLDAARSAVLSKLAERTAASAVTSQANIQTITDETETRRNLMAEAILHRANPSKPLSEGARNFSGLTMMDMARESLESRGISTRGMDRMKIAERAFESTSDLPNILANVANKSLRDAYLSAPRTFQPWARQGVASDFKTISRTNMSDAPALESVTENGEFKRGAVTDGKETYQLATVGKIIGITRQAIINDDLGAFTRLPALFANAAANYESDTVYGILTANAALSDGTALFHANHGNLTGTGTALSVTSLGVARALLRKQTTPQGAVMNLTPKYLIVPAALETIANQFVSQAYIAAQSSNINPFAGALQVVVDARLDASSATAWYLAADFNQVDTVEYAYLEGQNGVYIETRQGFDVDGMELKARLDFAAKAIDYRGLYKNVGA
jgi:hypothetical protein